MEMRRSETRQYCGTVSSIPEDVSKFSFSTSTTVFSRCDYRTKYEYDPYGNVTAQSGLDAADNPYRFSNKYTDSETDLLYYGYRYYLSADGRWLNRDPIGEEAFLTMYLTGRDQREQYRLRTKSRDPLYLFVKNIAISEVDPFGLANMRYRPLGGVLGHLGIVGEEVGEIDDTSETVIGHEQIFFEDDEEPSNIGFFNDQKVRADDGYTEDDYAAAHDSGWNDCVMRIAYPKVNPAPYSALGIGTALQYNCQDWVEEVRQWYRTLVKVASVLAQCCPTEAEKNK